MVGQGGSWTSLQRSYTNRDPHCYPGPPGGQSMSSRMKRRGWSGFILPPLVKIIKLVAVMVANAFLTSLVPVSARRPTALLNDESQGQDLPSGSHGLFYSLQSGHEESMLISASSSRGHTAGADSWLPFGLLFSGWNPSSLCFLGEQMGGEQLPGPRRLQRGGVMENGSTSWKQGQRFQL